MHWTYKQNARTVCPLLCILFSATMCLGVYFEFPFLWVGSVYLWAFMLLADRLSVVVAAVPSRLVRRYGSPSLLLSLPLIPMWRWPDDVDFHILKMVIVSVKIDCLFFFSLHGVTWVTWMEEIPVRAFTNIWKKVFFLQMWFFPL